MIKPASRWASVESILRRRLAEGHWTPGQPLPTYEEMETEFKVSRSTLQQAVACLKQDGFVVGVDRRGLYASQTPPCRFRFGVVIPRHENEIRFWREMVASARDVASAMGRELAVYRHFYTDPDCERRLLEDLGRHRLAGVLSAAPLIPDRPGYAVALHPGAPKATCVPMAAGSAPLLLSVRLDERLLVSRALDWLLARGRSRLAFFANLGKSPINRLFDEETARRGLRVPEEWRFNLSMENAELAEKIVRLLLKGQPGERPDGIFVGDDNLSAAVVRGIAATDRRIPDDIAVVTHYNWSCGRAESLPATGLGFDLAGMIRKVFDAFDHYHAEGTLPCGEMRVSPVFAEELAAASPAEARSGEFAAPSAG